MHSYSVLLLILSTFLSALFQLKASASFHDTSEQK